MRIYTLVWLTIAQVYLGASFVTLYGRKSLTEGEEASRAPEVGGAIVDILSLKATPPCSTLLLSDGTSWAAVILQVVMNWLVFCPAWAVGVFRATGGEREANGTGDQLSQVVPLARQIRLNYRCTNVVVISRDLTFLTAFAKRSLQDRLLVWSTKLLLVTRRALREVQELLEAHWTFSMLNTALLNLWEDEGGARYDVYLHMPYGPGGKKSRRVATWTARRGVVLSARQRLFPEKFLNFHGAEVKITALPFLPFWNVAKEKGNGGAEVERYTGSDYVLLETLAWKMNFTISILPSSSWSEATRFVEERLAFMTSIYHILPGRQERYDFTFTYEFAQFSFGLAKPFLRPRWQSLYYPLTDEVWAAILAAVVVVPLVLFVITRLWHVEDAEDENETRAWRTKLGRAAQDLTGMLLGQSPPQGLPRRSSTRVLVGAWLLFSMVVVYVYKGNLTASLMLPKYPPRPETLAELVTVVRKEVEEQKGRK
nr:glutamate receptor ionotropic, delta-1-like [Penaeus vannamei]